jgi:hypothetical protein
MIKGIKLIRHLLRDYGHLGSVEHRRCKIRFAESGGESIRSRSFYGTTATSDGVHCETTATCIGQLRNYGHLFSLICETTATSAAKTLRFMIHDGKNRFRANRNPATLTLLIDIPVPGA